VKGTKRQGDETARGRNGKGTKRSRTKRSGTKRPVTVLKNALILTIKCGNKLKHENKAEGPWPHGYYRKGLL
jgi:hypothetical protein